MQCSDKNVTFLSAIHMMEWGDFMAKRRRVDYDSITVICNGKPSEEVMTEYYSKLIDLYIKEHGKAATKLMLDTIVERIKQGIIV